MEFRPRLPPEEGINVSRTHPLREALVLGGGLLATAALLVVLAAAMVDLLVPHIPAPWEARLFGALRPSFEESSGAEVDRQRAALQSLLERLAAHWPDQPYRFQIWILNDPEPNALAFPGGLVGVTSGLLEQVESENELAFVLGHELGHFRHRHHLRNLGRGLVLSLVLSAALGNGGLSAAELLELAPMLTDRGFARDQEREADRFGLKLVYHEYGHVAAAGDFFKRLTKPGSRLGRQLAGYFSTHPMNSERIEALQDIAVELGWTSIGQPRPFSN